MPAGGARPGAGRKGFPIIPLSAEHRRPQEINLDALQAIAEVGGTLDEIASYFGITRKCLFNIRNRNKDVQDILTNAHNRGKLSLRRKLWQKAMKGDIAALIFLNKNENGMTDAYRAEVSGINGNPIEHKVTVESESLLDEFLTAIAMQKTADVIDVKFTDGTEIQQEKAGGSYLQLEPGETNSVRSPAEMAEEGPTEADPAAAR